MIVTYWPMTTPLLQRTVGGPCRAWWLGMPVKFIHRRTLFATLRTLWSRVILFKMDLQKTKNTISTDRIQLLDSCSTDLPIGREYKWSARIAPDCWRHDRTSPSKQQWLMGVQKVSLPERSMLPVGILDSGWVVSYENSTDQKREKRRETNCWLTWTQDWQHRWLQVENWRGSRKMNEHAGQINSLLRTFLSRTLNPTISCV